MQYRLEVKYSGRMAEVAPLQQQPTPPIEAGFFYVQP